MDGVAETVDRVRLAVNRHRFDVTSYHRMIDAGILNEDDRIELIDGELIEMASVGGPHIGAVMELSRALTIAAGETAWVSVQNPVQLGDMSEPEPDIALLRPRADAYRAGPPLAADVLLLVEVAASSLVYDRGVKLPLYARHGIPEVWIVDLDGRAVTVCRGPGADGYASMAQPGEDETIAPAALPAARMTPRDILGPS